MTRRRKLEVVRDKLGDCKRCGLCKTRTNIAFGVGSPDAQIVFVGEAPGEDEDIQGEPFVGKAGQLLTQAITALGWSRETVYIMNVLKCRPPENRNPKPNEIEKCFPFALQQLKAINPAIIITLGNVATKTLFGIEDGIMSIRGKWREWEGIPVMPTYHPSFLLRMPTAKPYLWKDFKAVNAKLLTMGVRPPFHVASA
jgi:uracil-DNA glycosylase family 4